MIATWAWWPAALLPRSKNIVHFSTTARCSSVLPPCAVSKEVFIIVHRSARLKLSRRRLASASVGVAKVTTYTSKTCAVSTFENTGTSAVEESFRFFFTCSTSLPLQLFSRNFVQNDFHFVPTVGKICSIQIQGICQLRKKAPKVSFSRLRPRNNSSITRRSVFAVTKSAFGSQSAVAVSVCGPSFCSSPASVCGSTVSASKYSESAGRFLFSLRRFMDRVSHPCTHQERRHQKTTFYQHSWLRNDHSPVCHCVRRHLPSLTLAPWSAPDQRSS